MTVTDIDRPTRSAPNEDPGEQVAVLVVDDHRGFAEMLLEALAEAGMTPLGTAHTGAEALAAAAELRPDLVVMDIQLPGQDGLVTTRQLRELVPDAVIAVLTAHRDADWVARAARAGAAAFIPKHASIAELLHVLEHAGPGQFLVAPSAFKDGNEHGCAAGEDTDRPVGLSPRERQVLQWLSQGLQVKEIARTVGITQETCRSYVKSLHTKLDAHSQLQLVLNAQQHGLLPPTVDI